MILLRFKVPTSLLTPWVPTGAFVMSYNLMSQNRISKKTSSTVFHENWHFGAIHGRQYLLFPTVGHQPRLAAQKRSAWPPIRAWGAAVVGLGLVDFSHQNGRELEVFLMRFTEPDSGRRSQNCWGNHHSPKSWVNQRQILQMANFR